MKPVSITTFTNLKGGTGKTTSVTTCATALGELGERILVVDTDPQGNASTALLEKPPPKEKSLAYALERGLPLEAIALSSISRNVDIIASDISTWEYAARCENRIGRDVLLKPLFNTDALGEYDKVFIDTNITQNCILSSALSASDFYVIPMEAKTYSKNGLKDIFRYAMGITTQNPGLRLAGCFITNFDTSSPAELRMLEILKRLTQQANILLLGSPVTRSKAVESAVQEGKTLFTYIARRKLNDEEFSDLSPQEKLRRQYAHNPAVSAYIDIACALQTILKGRVRGKEQDAAANSTLQALAALSVVNEFEVAEEF